MKKNFWILPLILMIIVSCKKQDYITGGHMSNPISDQTTYDYLKGNSMHLFDTLLLLVDAAGLKDAINQSGITFFAPTDYSIDGYLQARTLAAQKIDPNKVYSLDTMLKYDLDRLKDSLTMYIVPQTLPFSVLTQNGLVYPTGLPGDSVVVSYETTENANLGYSSLVSNVPQLVYFTQLWYPAPAPLVASEISASIGVHTLCQTSGIQTTTGMLDVLQNTHVLFFYGTKQ
jgi:hypothetical protein